MIYAYTLVKVEGWGWWNWSQNVAPKKKNLGVVDKIARLPYVKEVVPVYGDYDLIVRTEAKSLEEMDKFIYELLRKIPGISMTTTMTVAHIPETKK